MTMHVVGYESSGSESALTAITPIPDGTVVIQGNDIRVPTQIPNIFATATMINSATATLRSQLQSPSMRATLNFDINPIANGLVFGSLPVMPRFWDSPVALAPTEGLDAFVQNGAAVMNRTFVWFSDGPRKSVTGKIYTVRCTAAASLATASWVNSSLTFGQVLPAGKYSLVGARAWSANGCVFRFFQPGLPWRPGAPMQNTEAGDLWYDFRYGNLGEWLQFDNVTFPSVDFMGITDTAQTVYMDLIKTA